MPVPIGSFISTHVYDGHLKTHHALTSRKTCQFVNVSNSKEKQSGKSWIVSRCSLSVRDELDFDTRFQNYQEAAVVIGLARHLTERGLAFRIITPYDPQRSHIENQLKQEKLPFEDKVFNVD